MAKFHGGGRKFWRDTMNTLLLYALIPLSTMMIVLWTRSNELLSAAKPNIFGYGRRLLFVMLMCCFVPLTLAIFICAVSLPEMSRLSIISMLSIGALLSLAIAVFRHRLKAYTIEFVGNGMNITGLMRSTTVSFTDIAMAKKVRGLRSTYITLYPVLGRKKFVFYDTLQNFDGLWELIKAGAIENGVKWEDVDLING